MADEEPKQSPAEGSKQRTPIGSRRNVGEGLFTPRFKSMAAMAGWDEDAILVASLVVEDTPDRDVKSKRKSGILFKSPSSASLRRKPKNRRRSSTLIHGAVLNLDEGETPKQDNDKKEVEEKAMVDDEITKGEKELSAHKSEDSCSKSALPCMEKLREELSCAICLDICFEPSTTSCGHSFCKQCLRSAATKCGKKCPKCRQLISSGRSCPVNTVLWNTIQLLFPQEVEARKDAAKDSECEEVVRNRSAEREASNTNSNHRRRLVRNSEREAANSNSDIRRSVRVSRLQSSREARRDLERERSSLSSVLRSRGGNARPSGIVSQDNDAALALRMQREEFMVAFRGSGTRSFTSARERLRAMASRAINHRIRHHPV